MTQMNGKQVHKINFTAYVFLEVLNCGGKIMLTSLPPTCYSSWSYSVVSALQPQKQTSHEWQMK